MPWQREYLARWYSRKGGWIDGTTQFHAMCAGYRHAGERILEIGAGPSNPTTGYLAAGGPVCGVDTDKDVLGNEHLADARVMEGPRIPYPDRDFALCVSNFVLEHVEDPQAHLSEVRRLLKPGGHYLFRTPNRWHYVAGVSRVTPHWFHVLVANRLRGHAEGSHAPYPTYYRLNSKSQLERWSKRTGLEVKELIFVEKEPSYGMSSRALFLAFMLYERLVNSSDALWFGRASIFGVLQRPADS